MSTWIVGAVLKVSLALLVLYLILAVLLYFLNEYWNHRRSNADCEDLVRSERFDSFVRCFAGFMYFLFERSGDIPYGF